MYGVTTYILDWLQTGVLQPSTSHNETTTKRRAVGCISNAVAR
jgi:hypothetical protein